MRSFNNTIPYAELCSKSCFSFLVGASQPAEMIQRAKELNYRSLALCDRGGFYGMVRAYDKAKELGLHFIVGSEIQVANFSLILLAKDFRGYKNICRLISLSSTPSLSQVMEWVHPQHTQCLLAPRDFPSQSELQILRDLQPTQLVTKRFQVDADYKMKKWLENLPKEIPLAWTWDAFFHEKNRFEVFQVLQAIRENKKLSEILPSFNAEAYLKNLQDLKRYQVPREYLLHNLKIAESCQFSPSEIRYHYPQEWLPAGKKAPEFLRELCQLGLQQRYSNGASSKVLAQLEYELKLIRELQYEDYFLTVWDIVAFARSKKILCQGRGSAANSIVCYLLEVTSIDPVQMNLLFERFISKERDEAPDIDVDFEHERREEVIQYVYQKYGRHRAGMVATLITYRTRSALRDVGKALGVGDDVLELLSKRSRWREAVLDQSTEDRSLARLFRLAKAIKGFPRHLGQHTGGMIICQDRLDEISPIQPARMENRSVVQWDKYDIEKLGLLKIDLLALGMLSCLRKSFDLLREHGFADLELHQIPHDDSKTYDMIQTSRTMGVFQIESRAQMSMLPRLRPRNFYDLVVEVAIVRPGPIQGGMVHPYLRHRMGLEKVEYAHPLLKPILEKTLGIPIFQEQVMKMAIEVAGYSPGEADELRRAMGAWKKSGNLESFAEDICQRLVTKGIAEDFSKRICQQILGFGEYGFPESHAASFALLTYASAYLKAHYPAVFLCALLNSMPLGFYSRHVLLSSFRQENIAILPVNLELSLWEHRLEQLKSQQWAVRLGFRSVRGLKKENVEAFIESRKKKDPNLLIFNVDERAALAIACYDDEERRPVYWQALESQKDSLKYSRAKAPRFSVANPLEQMMLDFEFIESTLREHPVSLIKKSYWSYAIPSSKLCAAKDLSLRRNNENVYVFGSLEVVQSPPTAKGMFFITLQDETGFLNLVLKPVVYQKFKELIQSQAYLLVGGKRQAVQDYSSILVHQVMAPLANRAKLYQLKDSAKKPSMPDRFSLKWMDA